MTERVQQSWKDNPEIEPTSRRAEFAPVASRRDQLAPSVGRTAVAAQQRTQREEQVVRGIGRTAVDRSIERSRDREQ